MDNEILEKTKEITLLSVNILVNKRILLQPINT